MSQTTKTKVVAVVNQKGGVGKTTTALHLAAAVAIKQKSTLLIDFDMQYNLTSNLGLDFMDNELEGHTIYDLISGEASLTECILADVKPDLDLIPSYINLAAAEVVHSHKKGWQSILKKIVQKIIDNEDLNYELIMIDTPPSLGFFTINSLVACDWVVIPVRMETNSIAGLNYLSHTILDLSAEINRKINIAGILMSKVDSRRVVDREIVSQLNQLEDYGLSHFNTIIRPNTEIVKAELKQMTVYENAPRSTGSKDYALAAVEFMQKIGIEND